MHLARQREQRRADVSSTGHSGRSDQRRVGLGNDVRPSLHQGRRPADGGAVTAAFASSSSSGCGTLMVKLRQRPPGDLGGGGEHIGQIDAAGQIADDGHVGPGLISTALWNLPSNSSISVDGSAASSSSPQSGKSKSQ